MRIPFPERLPLFPVLVFCFVLCALQLIEGTTAEFTLGTFLFVFIAVLAFNLAGGLRRPSGSYIFAFTLLGALFGICCKVLVNEPGNTNLLQPTLTIGVYVGTVTAMLIAAFVSKKLRFKAKFFSSFRSDEDMFRSAVGCLLVGGAVLIYSSVQTTDVEAGSLRGAVAALGNLLPLALLFGVMYEVRKSGGSKSTNWVVWTSGSLIFVSGVIGYSKQGMFTSLAVWLFTAAACRYRISVAQIGGLVVVGAFLVIYMVPYSQYGRAFRQEGASFGANLEINIFQLQHLGLIRELYNSGAGSTGSDDDVGFSYFNQSEGLADRLQMISVDDALINATENGAVFGIFPTLFYFENTIPHFIWPSKPTLSFGNIYAHEVGIVTIESDTSTGVSFSPASDAYHQAKWPGILVMLPLLLIMLFTLSDSIGGDTSESPFALGLLVGFLHSAPEGGIGGIVGGSIGGMAALFVIAFVTARIMPLAATLIMGPPKLRFSPATMAASVPGRFAMATNVSQEGKPASS